MNGEQRFNQPVPHEGSWGAGCTWSFVLSTELPPRELISGTACLVVVPDGILLTKNHRGGWEVPGGHIEPGEDLAECLRRECLEEVGVELERHELFGHLAIRNLTPRRNPSTGLDYPPLSHILLYAGASRRPLRIPSGAEIVDTLIVSFQDQVLWQSLVVAREPVGWYGLPIAQRILEGLR